MKWQISAKISELWFDQQVNLHAWSNMWWQRSILLTSDISIKSQNYIFENQTISVAFHTRHHWLNRRRHIQRATIRKTEAGAGEQAQLVLKFQKKGMSKTSETILLVKLPEFKWHVFSFFVTESLTVLIYAIPKGNGCKILGDAPKILHYSVISDLNGKS